MFDARDHVSDEWGSVPARRRRGGLSVTRVAWGAYRWTMIQFAKFILLEFGMTADGKLVEEAVDAWLTRSG